MKKLASRIYLAIIFVILYAPIVVLMVYSFNNSKTSKWNGFTLKWYQELFESSLIMSALQTTLILAFLSATIATLLGVISCLGIQALKPRFRHMMMALNNIPMVNSELVTGLALMILFIALRISAGFMTVLIAHITFCVPYVILSVMPRLKQSSKSTYEAALDLGATPFRAFFKVVMPDLMPGILSGYMLAFTMSLDDFIITHFTKGAGMNTLSTLIYSELRRGVKPTINALSTLMFLTVLIILLFMNRPRKETAK